MKSQIHRIKSLWDNRLDPLGTDFSGQVEVDRFVFIDKQLYGLMSVLGNGVVSGWTITKTGSFSVSIDKGYGNINFIAGRTDFPVSISNLPANSILYIYARANRRTRTAENVDFMHSPLSNIGDPNYLLLGKVITGPLAIDSIDTSLRQEIGFLEMIRAAIRSHKHRGGSRNPSKIDLDSEVKGQLPSFRIADFDAEKISTGTFEVSRIPMLDHSDLQNVGLLTHPQLDSFVKTLETSNKELFGEISTANLLQLLISMKFVHDDPDSSFYLADRLVDENWVNSFVVIPGVTPNRFIDFEATTADVNLEKHFIKGTSPTTGTSFYVNYDSALAWKAAHLLDRVTVVGDTVTLAFRDDDDTNLVVVEGFESATAQGQVLDSLFKKEIVVLQDSARVTADGNILNTAEGFWSGKFTAQTKFRTQYVKEFSSVQDWSTYDTFSIHVKCIDEIHGPVKMYFVSSDNELSIDYILLDTNETTSSENPIDNGYEQRTINLDQIPFVDRIAKFVIYTNDLETPFYFHVDDITIQRAVLLPDEGTLRLRYSSASRLTFSAMEWSSVEPSGTGITVRARAADGTVFLNRADWTPFLQNGSPLNLAGTDLDIEVKFYPNSEKTRAPILRSLRVLLLTEAEIDGYKLDSAEEFSRGTSENALINNDPASISLDTPIYVDSFYFCESNRVNQGHWVNSDGEMVTGNETNLGALHVEMDDVFMDGGKTPISPNLVFASAEKSGVSRINRSRLFEPRSVRRHYDRTYIVADTYNDRVLQFDEHGSLISGFGSIGYEHESKTFPIGSSYDPRTGILYVVWSRKIDFKNVNVGKITLQSTTKSVRLVKDFDKIMGLTTSELSRINSQGQILPIHLSGPNASLASELPGENNSYLYVDASAIPEMQTDSVFYKAVVTELGIPLFVGNFAYIEGIFAPTYAEKSDEGVFTVCNAQVAIKPWKWAPGVDEKIQRVANLSDIVQIDKNYNLIFGKSGIVQFSPFIPGRAEVLGSRLLIGGLKFGSVADPSKIENLTFRTMRGESTVRSVQKQILKEIFFSGNSKFSGTVVIYDLRSGSVVFEYTSPEGMLVSDVDIDPVTGEYIVAESSFDKSGRVIKLDAGGNIVFSFGEGLYSVINDISVQVDGSIVVST